MSLWTRAVEPVDGLWMTLPSGLLSYVEAEMAPDRIDAATLARMAALTDPRRVRRARESHHLTQAELARRLADAGHPISPPALSQIERGVTKPSPETLAALSSELDHPLGFFVGRGGPVGEPEPGGFFRSLRSTPARERRGALGKAALVHDLVAAVEQHVRLPELNLPRLSAMSPAEAAISVRRSWGIPAGPVPHVVRELERHGIIVARLDRVGERVDAFSVNFPGRPVVMLGNDKGKRDRSRFDASHELGHLVMHDQPSGDRSTENEAHAFAAEFLMPEQDIRGELRAERLDWRRLLDLKLRWACSISAIVRRARDLNVINDSQYTNFMKAISARGWRKDEPGDAELGPPEASTVLDLVEDHFLAHAISLSAVAEQAGLPLKPLQDIVSASRDPRPRLRF